MKPTDVPESHRLSELEVALLNLLQIYLRVGRVPEGVRHLLSKIEWKTQPEAPTKCNSILK